MERKYFILLGGPGSGKGTQAALASTKIGINHLSTGERFRALWTASDLSEMELAIKKEVDAGGYVPDENTNLLIKQWLSESPYSKGAFLDGYPRTMPQVEAFEKLLPELAAEIPAVFLFNVSRDALYIRMTKRVTCSKCGATFNTVTNPPKESGICDVCGGELTARKDQDEEAVMARFDIYFEKTAPIIDYYRAKNLLHDINGEASIEEVQKEFIGKLTPYL